MNYNLVLMKSSDIMSDHNVKLPGHIQNLVGQCPTTDCYFQSCLVEFLLKFTSNNGFQQLLLQLSAA